MTRAVFSPGIDQEAAQGETPGGYSPERGAGGVYAKILQGATPKYAKNSGARGDLFRDTMARMYVRIDATEMDLFLASVGDDHTRENLTRRLVGDPTPPQNRPPAVGRAPNVTAQRTTRADTNGYLDFFIQSVQMNMQEKIQVSETLSDNYVAYAFGQAPPVWVFSGALLNTVQDDQASNMYRLYTEILRATQLARRQKSLSISFDSYVVNGVMMNLNMGITAGNELMIPFSFQLLVKRVFIVNYTRGWVPTHAGTPFAADPLARDYDGAPRQDGVLTEVTLRLPGGVADVTPVPDSTAHPLVSMPVVAPPPPAAPVTPAPPRPPSQEEINFANAQASVAHAVITEHAEQEGYEALSAERERMEQNPTFWEVANPNRAQLVRIAFDRERRAAEAVNVAQTSLVDARRRLQSAQTALEQSRATANPTGASRPAPR